MNYKDEYNRWLEKATANENLIDELRSMDEAVIEDAFYKGFLSVLAAYVASSVPELIE